MYSKDDPADGRNMPQQQLRNCGVEMDGMRHRTWPPLSWLAALTAWPNCSTQPLFLFISLCCRALLPADAACRLAAADWRERGPQDVDRDGVWLHAETRTRRTRRRRPGVSRHRREEGLTRRRWYVCSVRCGARGASTHVVMSPSGRVLGAWWQPLPSFLHFFRGLVWYRSRSDITVHCRFHRACLNLPPLLLVGGPDSQSLAMSQICIVAATLHIA